eukprot:5963510-Pleurochrysis_carterae.AAC.4
MIATTLLIVLGVAAHVEDCTWGGQMHAHRSPSFSKGCMHKGGETLAKSQACASAEKSVAAINMHVRGRISPWRCHMRSL